MTGTKGRDLLFIRGFKVPPGKRIKSDSDGRERLRVFSEEEKSTHPWDTPFCILGTCKIPF